MTTDDEEPLPPLPALLPLADMTLPPGAKLNLAEESKPVVVVKPAVVEEEQPFIIIERAFPRIAEAVHLMWGHAECEDYLQKLIVDDRGDREGFKQDVHKALLKLYNQHVTLFTFERAKDIWSYDPLAKLGAKPPNKPDKPK